MRSSTVKYLRDLADQIERGITLCLDIRIAPDETQASKSMHLHLTYRSLSDHVDAAGLAYSEKRKKEMTENTKADPDLIERVNRALQRAGRPDEGWNLRFRNGLEAERLTLVPESKVPPALDNWITAPYPHGDNHTWPEGTAIVCAPSTPA
jgi:hypothetical protein